MPDSRKIRERGFAKKEVKLDLEVQDVLQLMRQVNQGASDEAFLSPQKRPDGRYVTSESNLDRWIDPRIFRETQIKRMVRWLTTTPPLFNFFFTWLFIKKIGFKVDYFSQQENKNSNKMFKEGSQHALKKEETKHFTLHNLGHATQLIQTSGMNILTDPVFGNLAPIIYPDMTRDNGKNVKPEHLPPIDVILISHNHRDHVDVDSLKILLKNAKDKHVTIPQLLVPLGDEYFFKALGFPNVRAFEWHEQITILSKTGESVTFCSVPADHRSGRKGYDAHQSLVMGWTISPENRNEILYFGGDTARINDARMKSLAVDIYHMYLEKKKIKPHELPKLINMLPGGPNYTRKDMEPTHQSAVDSIVSMFRLAIALNKVSQVDKKTEFTPDLWLNASASIFMHQNKFELGPDRFNENVFIYTRLLSYLKMDEAALQLHERKQEVKSSNWSLFHRRKDFIIAGARELRILAAEIWPDMSNQERNEKLVQVIQAKVHFPLINEKLNAKDVFKFKMGEASTILPDTFVEEGTDTSHRKGEKRLGP